MSNSFISIFIFLFYRQISLFSKNIHFETVQPVSLDNPNLYQSFPLLHVSIKLRKQQHRETRGVSGNWPHLYSSPSLSQRQTEIIINVKALHSKGNCLTYSMSPIQMSSYTLKWDVNGWLSRLMREWKCQWQSRTAAFLSICTMHYNHRCLCRWSQFEWQLIGNDQMVCLCEKEKILELRVQEIWGKCLCEPTEALFGYF